MLLDAKVYLKILFLIFALMLSSAVAYAYYFGKHYPLPFTNRISLDAKIQFIRNHIDTDNIDTIVVGSSIGLNNVRGEYLEKYSSSCKHVLNLSVFEASPIQVEQLLELIDVFPKLKRIIYSAQFSDFQHLSTFKNYNSEIIKKYISHQLNPIQEAKFIFKISKNLPFLVNRQKIWKEKYGKNNTFSYLGFDHTGSAPLHIYGKDIVRHRWVNPHGSKHLKKAFDALGRMSKKAHARGVKFYLVQQPYRQALIKKYPHVPTEANWFFNYAHKVVIKNNGYSLSLYRELALSDDYFADRSHLNDKGSILSAEAIGKFIDMNEK